MSEYTSLEQLIMEATTTVEKELALEDTGWTKLGSAAGEVISSTKRIEYVKQSRIYHALDPLAHQALRLWTDYTFGTGMNWSTEEESTRKVLESFWYDKANRKVLGALGQRKSSDKLLVDGEVFFAVFLGAKGRATIRRIDPLEITEILTDPDDAETVMFYKRDWTDRQGKTRIAYYRSFSNKDNKPALDAQGKSITSTEDALVYHLLYNSNEERGNPLLLPALDWIKQYRRFLASRVAIVLALAKFAWKNKVAGSAATVAAVKSVYQDAVPASGSMAVENASSDLQPIKVETGAGNAYNDGRMLKLQICAAVGIPEQYFGDISIGNLATAKTVELPMLKMFQSYQAIWGDAYNEIDDLVLEHNNISPDERYIDRDFPAIALEDALAVAQALAQIITVIPSFVDSRDVQQQALIALGINDPSEVLDELEKLAKESAGDVNVKLAKALREFKEVINGSNGNKSRGSGDSKTSTKLPQLSGKGVL